MVSKTFLIQLNKVIYIRIISNIIKTNIILYKNIATAVIQLIIKKKYIFDYKENFKCNRII
jgi:hypothetical protein